MKNIVFALLIFALSGCNIAGQGQFGSREMKKHFTDSEIMELEKIVSFVDSIVLTNTGISDINRAYHSYLDSVNKLLENGAISFFSLDEEYKNAFFESLDEKVFLTIWAKRSVSQEIRTIDTVIQIPAKFISAELNSHGKFLDYIKELGGKKEEYSDIYDGIKQAGSLNPVTYAEFLSPDRNYDFDDKNNRLWAAVFILSSGEDVDQKVERYLEQLD